METMFEPVLEKNEKIIKVYKPDKRKYWFSTHLWTMLSTLWFAILIITGSIGGSIESGYVTNALEGILVALVSILAAAVFHVIVFYACVYPFARLNYKNRYYAYTNKRILIRRGIFGIDFLSLEFKFLTATVVKVNLIDKLVKRNTGSITFGSPSSPIGGGASAGYGNNNRYNAYLNPYSFAHILQPYDTLREINEIIDALEKQKEK